MGSDSLGTVLVVDDEPIILRSVRAALAKGYQILEAGDANKALGVSKQFNGPIDLIMADRTLKGVTGQKVVSEIRAARPSIQVLYFSSYSREHPANGGLPEDAEILEKPFLPRDLRGSVFRILRYNRAAPAATADDIEAQQIEVRNPRCVEKLRDELFARGSLFGRLIAASQLWKWEKDRYEHPLSSRFGWRDIDDAVRFLHHETLTTWLSSPLSLQIADFRVYLGGVGVEARQLMAMGKAALPQTAMDAERQHFLSELSAIQALLAIPAFRGA